MTTLRLALVALLALALPLAARSAPADAKQRKDALVRYQAAEKAFQAKEWEAAEREFTAAIALDPLQTLALHGLGRTYMALKKYPDALQAFERARSAFAELEGLRLRGEAVAEERIEEQIRALEDTVRGIRQGTAKPIGADSTIAQIESQIRELERSRKRGESAAASVPAALPLSIGSAHFRMGNLAEAEKAYLEAIAIDPRLGEAHNNLAVVYLLGGRAAEAEREAEAAEKNGYPVHPQLKNDIAARKKGS